MSQSVKLILDDGEYELDLGRFMLSEAQALEDEWGVDTLQFAQQVTSGSPPLRVVGAMVWLVKVRSRAAAEGISFRDAAQQMPVASFDTDLMAVRIDAEAKPENPTPGGTRKQGTRTTRATSAKPRTKRASSAVASPTKASSPSS